MLQFFFYFTFLSFFYIPFLGRVHRLLKKGNYAAYAQRVSAPGQ